MIPFNIKLEEYTQKRIDRFGANQKNVWEFYQRNLGWQSFAKDSLTKRTIKSLADLGLIEISDISLQARCTNFGKNF